MIRDAGESPDPFGFRWLRRVKVNLAGIGRSNERPDETTPDGGKPDLRLRDRSSPPNLGGCRSENVFQINPRWRKGNAGSALDFHAAEAVGEGKNGKNRLKNEPSRSSRSDSEPIVPALRLRSRSEGEQHGMLGDATGFCIDERSGCLDGRHVLSPQTGLTPIGSHVEEPESLTGDRRERARGAHDLASPFPKSPIDLNHERTYSSSRIWVPRACIGKPSI